MYYTYSKEPPQNSIGNYLGPFIILQGPVALYRGSRISRTARSPCRRLYKVEAVDRHTRTKVCSAWSHHEFWEHGGRCPAI